MHLKISGANFRTFQPAANDLTSDIAWRHGFWSTLFQVTACCLMVLSYSLKACWILISRALAGRFRWFLFFFIKTRTSSRKWFLKSCSKKVFSDVIFEYGFSTWKWPFPRISRHMQSSATTIMPVSNPHHFSKYMLCQKWENCINLANLTLVAIHHHFILGRHYFHILILAMTI